MQTRRTGMGGKMSGLVLALFIIALGMSVAGTGTYLYQTLSRQTAGFRISGETAVEGVMNLFIIFICGPYLLLRMGCQSDGRGQISIINVLLAAFIAFSWSFVSGLMILGTYVSLLRFAV